MSAKTTATVNIVDASLFVDTCIECGIQTHLTDNKVRFGNINGPYHNCELKYSDENQTYILEGDDDFVKSLIKTAMPLYNTKHLCNVLNDSGRYRVAEDSIEKQNDGSYIFKALELQVVG